MKLSILVTCYNAADTIERAILSAIRCEWPFGDKEILVCNDCSSDRSSDILRSLQAKFDFHLIENETNEFYAGSLNRLIKLSTGDFILINDDDDESMQDRAIRQFEKVKESGVDLKHGSWLCYGGRDVYESDVMIGRRTPIGAGANPPSGSIVADFLLWNSIGAAGYDWGDFGSCTLFAPLQFIQKVGPFDPSFRRGAEHDFAVRSAQKGATFLGQHDAVIKQHITTGDDKEGPDRALTGHIRLRAKHIEYLQERKKITVSLVDALYRASCRKSDNFSNFFHSIKKVILRSLLILLSPGSTGVSHFKKLIQKTRMK